MLNRYRPKDGYVIAVVGHHEPEELAAVMEAGLTETELREAAVDNGISFEQIMECCDLITDEEVPR